MTSISFVSTLLAKWKNKRMGAVGQPKVDHLKTELPQISRQMVRGTTGSSGFYSRVFFLEMW
jgi:hypothetical protein